MYHFIVNPNARTGLGHKIWVQLEAVLKSRSVPYQVHFTHYQNHAASIAKKITSDGKKHTIVALGGDGTVNEVVNGITDLSLTTLGYIPIGSSNDFARGMNIPQDPFAALELVLSPSAFTYTDIGVLSMGDTMRRFAGSSGIGFDAAVCERVAVSKLKSFLNRIKLGKLTYAAIALSQLAFMKKVHLSLTLDDGTEKEFPDSYFAAGLLQGYEGGGLLFCPNAKKADGLLDIIVVSGLSRLKVITLLPLAFRGKHTRFRGVHIFRAKSASIKSDIKASVHTDGEPLSRQRELRISLAGEKLRVITRG